MQQYFLLETIYFLERKSEITGCFLKLKSSFSTLQFVSFKGFIIASQNFEKKAEILKGLSSF